MLPKVVTIPTTMTPELAEEVGIHVGDGSMYIYRPRNGGPKYIWKVSGNLREDAPYLLGYVKSLELNLYAVRPNTFRRYENTVDLIFQSKRVLEFKSKILGLPIGRKGNITIPKPILASNNKIMASFIRGLIDTDGALCFEKGPYPTHSEPEVTIASRSLTLLTSLKHALLRLGFKAGVNFRQRVWEGHVRRVGEIRVWGSSHLEKWTRTIGFSNLRNLTKHAIWERHGFCPPRTTFAQRVLILSEKLSPYADPVTVTNMVSHSDHKRLFRRLLKFIQDRYDVEYSLNQADLKEGPLSFSINMPR